MIKKADGAPKFVTKADLFGLAKEDLEVMLSAAFTPALVYIRVCHMNIFNWIGICI